MHNKQDDFNNVVQLIRDAGGRLVGRTRLQKIACLLELAHMGNGFHFDYYHYGPYSEELAQAATVASAMGLIDEEVHRAEWGGKYSIYIDKGMKTENGCDETRCKFIHKAVSTNAITLELAATAAYLASEGIDAPWEETLRRKPDKAEGDGLDEAKQLYQELRNLAPSLPEI